MCDNRVITALSAQPLASSNVASGRWVCDAASHTTLCVASGATADVIITGNTSSEALSITLEPHSHLRIIATLCAAESSLDLRIKQLEESECRITEIVTAAAVSRVEASLDGRGARFELGGAFILTDKEQGSVTVDVKHNTSECTSRTTFKGVASGEAIGRFSGLVYVAPDAQHTDSEQLSRNITLGAARIDALPQLEIYADDVRCSHGATVGQMDDEAVLYMRQRGLSLATAKRLQIEGFVSDVVLRAAVEECRETLVEMLDSKLEKL